MEETQRESRLVGWLLVIIAAILLPFAVYSAEHTDWANATISGLGAAALVSYAIRRLWTKRPRG